jgi:uncharacterized membrane protein YeaQ/YmgE (transglycosylase-associated protein family)
MGVIATLIVGLVAGWITGLLMKSHSGILLDMLLGIVGGFAGGWLTSLVFGANLMSGINITSVIVAVVGAVIVVAVYRLITGRRVV